MKRRFEVFHDVGFESTDGKLSKELIKAFKNEPEAMTFYNDDKNIRRYGTMYMKKTDTDGITYNYDDRTGAWMTT